MTYFRTLYLLIMHCVMCTMCDITNSDIFETDQVYDDIENYMDEEHQVMMINTLKDLAKLGEESTLKKNGNLTAQQLNTDTIRRNEDIYLNITQLVTKYFYRIEEYLIDTEDGYILKIFRIPSCGPVVLLMHGLTSSADDWVTPGPDNGIAYLLANQGYDVWMGNARGNKHSRNHRSLDPVTNASLFWDFSWDEIGRYDLPAMIDFVLNKTGQPTLKYIGHSQGTTSFFVMASERPEYNEKVSLMIALSAVAWMSHIRSPLARLFLNLSPSIFLGAYEVSTSEVLQRERCGTMVQALLFCSNIALLICGFDYSQLNIPSLPVIYTHTPAGAATKQFDHYGQVMKSGKFRKFDYGREKNLEIYGQVEPPLFLVDKITAPVAIFYSKGDWLGDIRDVRILMNKLPNLVEFYTVPHKRFNHIDFIWAKGIKRLVMTKLLKLIERF